MNVKAMTTAAELDSKYGTQNSPNGFLATLAAEREAARAAAQPTASAEPTAEKENNMEPQIELFNADGLTAEGETFARWLSRYIATLPTDRTQIEDMAARAYAEQVIDGDSLPSVFFAKRMQDTMQLYGRYALSLRNPTKAQADQARAAQADADNRAVKAEIARGRTAESVDRWLPSTAWPVASLEYLVDTIMEHGPVGAPPEARRLISLIEDGADGVTILGNASHDTIMGLYRFVRTARPPLDYYDRELARMREGMRPVVDWHEQELARIREGRR